MASRKGYTYIVTAEQIREYRRLTPRQKLEWLEAANRFCHKALRGKRRQVWEAFRQGKI